MEACASASLLNKSYLKATFPSKQHSGSSKKPSWWSPVSLLCFLNRHHLAALRHHNIPSTPVQGHPQSTKQGWKAELLAHPSHLPPGTSPSRTAHETPEHRKLCLQFHRIQGKLVKQVFPGKHCAFPSSGPGQVLHTTHLSTRMNSKDTITAPKNCKSLVKNAELGKTNYLNAPHQILLSGEFTAEVTKALVWKKPCKPTGSFFKDRFFWVP